LQGKEEIGMTKYWVNAPGAHSVAYDSKMVAEAVAEQIKGASVSKGVAKPKGRHLYADGSSTASAMEGRRKSLWQRLVG